jgi:hypothetical protein
MNTSFDFTLHAIKQHSVFCLCLTMCVRSAARALEKLIPTLDAVLTQVF